MMHTLPLRRLRGVVALVCFVAVFIPVAALAADDPPPVVTPGDPPAMRVLSPEEALRMDAQTIAAERGWDEEATLALLKRQEVTGAFVAQLAVKYPHTFGGAWTGDGVDGQLFVRFVGQVPVEVQDQAKQQGIVTVFLGGAKQSLAHLQGRSQQVHADLLAHGHPQVVTAFSVQEETIVGTATRARFDTRPAAELRARLSAESRASDVVLTFAQGPIIRNHDTYGGDKTLLNGVWKCTTGFTVYVGVTKGVSSAGHCSNPNTYQQENGVTFGMTFQREHRGTWGDFEWYTTPTSTVFPRFYSNVGVGRDQVAIESASAIKENNYYCKFGRATNYTCDNVKFISVDGTSGGFTHGRLVVMKKDQAVGGDSGGPWFNGTTAAGIHSGNVLINGVNTDAWAKADYLDEALPYVNIWLK